MSNSKNHIDIRDIVMDFCNWYYSSIASKGVASVSHIFSPHASCIYDNVEYSSHHELMVILLSEGVNRIEYDDVSLSYSLIDNNTLLIQSYGVCSGISYDDKTIGTHKFTETFILKHHHDKKEPNKFFVSNYIFKLL